MSFIESLLQMSLAGGVMIAAVIVVRALTLRRLPKRTFPVLWYAALARLLLPLSVPCALSVYTLFARLNEAPAAEVEPVAVSVPAVAPVVPAYVPAPAAVYEPSAVNVSPAFSIDGETVALMVWLLGAIVCAAFFAVVYLRSRREFNQSLPLENDFTRRWLDGHKLRRKISLRQSDRIGAPLTYGVLRPVILMPKSTDWDDGEAVKYVLEHEFAHVRRFDAAGKLVLTAAVCLHWFNPLVWGMYVLANRDLELACDEAVLRRLGRETRAEYAMTLIRMAEAEGKNGPAPLCSGFGKSAVEERITAIMKMKKTSLAALVVAAVLVVGVTTVFATSAATADREELDRRANAQTVAAEDTVLSRADEDGNMWYSTDGGKTWLSQEEFDAAFPAADVEWWTYDEYAAWLENEKVELQAMLGERGWTQSRGWFVWTQKEIDKTIAVYEGILEQIGQGAKVSKTVNGSENTLLIQNPDTIQLGIAELKEYRPTAEDFAEYEPYGLEWREKEKALFFNGERVRYFIDGAELDVGMAIRFEYSDVELKGEVDVHTVRSRTDNGDGSYDPMGPLTGLEKYSQDEFDAHTFPVGGGLRSSIDGEGDIWILDIDARVEDYVPFGLGYRIHPVTGELSMSYDGKPVHSLYDAQTGVWIANNMNGWDLGPDAVDLEAVYENGKLTGLKESPAPSAQAATAAVAGGDASTAEATATTTVIAQGTGSGKAEPGTTFAEKFEKYASIQIVYEEAEGASGKGNVYHVSSLGYQGKRDRYLISHFVDVSPDGSVFTFDSADSGGLSVQTVYGADGELSGATVTASPVVAEPLKDGEEVVGVNGLIYSHGRISYGYVRATDFDPDGGLVPLYDKYCNVVGCFNNDDSIEHDTPKSPNKVLVDGFICIRALGTGTDGSYPVSGYIREIDHNPDMGDTPEERMEYINTHPDYGKRREIPLYNDNGKVIGSFEFGGSITIPSSVSSIDEARDYLKNYGNDE